MKDAIQVVQSTLLMCQEPCEAVVRQNQPLPSDSTKEETSPPTLQGSAVQAVGTEYLEDWTSVYACLCVCIFLSVWLVGGFVTLLMVLGNLEDCD